MNDHKTKHGEWVRNFVDNGSILWDGENVSTFIVMDSGSIIHHRPYTDNDRKPVTNEQARNAEAVLRASDFCPNPWPGEVDELPEGGIPGYWRDKYGYVWNFRHGHWSYAIGAEWWTSPVNLTTYRPFTPTVLPKNAKQIETPEKVQPEERERNKFLCDGTIHRNHYHWTSNDRLDPQDEVEPELKQHGPLRSVLESMTKEQIIDALMNAE